MKEHKLALIHSVQSYFYLLVKPVNWNLLFEENVVMFYFVNIKGFAFLQYIFPTYRLASYVLKSFHF